MCACLPFLCSSSACVCVSVTPSASCSSLVSVRALQNAVVKAPKDEREAKSSAPAPLNPSHFRYSSQSVDGHAVNHDNQPESPRSQQEVEHDIAVETDEFEFELEQED